jgi:hypothetical protein
MFQKTEKKSLKPYAYILLKICSIKNDENIVSVVPYDERATLSIISTSNTISKILQKKKEKLKTKTDTIKNITKYYVFLAICLKILHGAKLNNRGEIFSNKVGPSCTSMILYLSNSAKYKNSL